MAKPLQRLLENFCNVKISFRTALLPSGDSMNYVELIRPNFGDSQIANQKQDGQTLVLMHGFGLGLGFFFSNFDALVSKNSPFSRVIAVDWLGMGNSSRSSCKRAPIRRLIGINNDKHTIDHEDYFLNSMEQWRQVVGLDKFVMAGHSLGGFLCAKYALKHPEFIQALIMISPVGLQDLPAREHRLHPLHKIARDQMGWKFSSLLQLVTGLWSLNVTPQSLLRCSGERGLRLLDSTVQRRFGGTASNWSPAQAQAVSSYLHDISTSSPSGEYALNSLLRPMVFIDPHMGHKVRNGVFARHPVGERVATLRMPVLLLYGDHDWLGLQYPEAAADVARWRSQGVQITLDTVPQAGHHLYMDNPAAFHESMFRWINKSCV